MLLITDLDLKLSSSFEFLQLLQRIHEYIWKPPSPPLPCGQLGLINWDL